jgi:hypothetical protein
MTDEGHEPAGGQPEPVDGMTSRPGDGPEAPPVAVAPPEIVTDPPPSEPVATLEPAPPAAESVAPAPPTGLLAGGKRYTGRIILIYALLLAAFGGAIAGVILLETGGGSGSGGSSAKGWSEWRPDSGTTSAMTKQIADHVGHEYKLNKAGAQLVAIVSEPPLVTSGTHKVAISNIAIRKTSKSDKGIRIVPSTHIWTDEFCGLGSRCSIASGQASETRGRLVRREALEVALYTFKYVPAVDTVVAFMPPPPGQQQSTLLFLQKENLTQELAQPLRKTLPLEKPPLPSEADPKEQATIDRLTLPTVYQYHLQQLQDASALLVLDPFPS